MSRTPLLGLAVVLALAGCAPLTVPETLTTEYVCADGGDFRLIGAGAGMDIEIAGMRFGLQSEPGSAGETIHSCSMLKLSQRGGIARVEMEGRPYLDDCRPKR